MWPCENFARAGTKQSMVSFHTSKKREMRPVTKALIRDIVFTKGKIKIKWFIFSFINPEEAWHRNSRNCAINIATVPHEKHSLIL